VEITEVRITLRNEDKLKALAIAPKAE